MSAVQKKEISLHKYSEERLRIIFEYSPIAIWEEDFSALGHLHQTLIKRKVSNIRLYLSEHRDLVVETFRKLRVLDVNKAALDLYGAKTKSELMSNLGKTFHRDAIPVLIDEFASLIEGKKIFEAEFKSKTINGKIYDVSMRVSVPDIYEKNFKRVIVTFRDISVQKKYERHLKRLAQMDGLTKVLNHTAIRYRLEEEFMRAKRYHLDLTCLMIDMDHFKSVNDQFGHLRGDQVLKRTAKLIKGHLREVDVVGRYGGDEFLVILPETSQDNSMVAARRIRDLFASLKTTKPKSHGYTTLTIGVGGRPNVPANSAKELLSKIDKAMYAAKKAGRNDIAIAQ